jgi:hypothetical protein
MYCLVTASKHVKNIRAVARQAPITTTELIEAVFSVGPVPRLYNENPRPAEAPLEEDKILVITKRVLNLMKQNGRCSP